MTKTYKTIEDAHVDAKGKGPYALVYYEGKRVIVIYGSLDALNTHSRTLAKKRKWKSGDHGYVGCVFYESEKGKSFIATYPAY